MIGLAFGALLGVLGSVPDPEILPIPELERAALIALYAATGGAHWSNHDNWLGERGTECEWHGVECGPWGGGTMLEHRVWDVDLSRNNLVGTLPEELDSLEHLEYLRIGSNHLSGALPPRILQRWKSGELGVQGYGDLAGLSEIRIQYRTAVYCVDFEAKISADGSIELSSERCKGETRMRWQGAKGVHPYCEMQKGETDLFGDAFGRLALLLEEEGFYALKPAFYRGITHGGTVTISVVRRGDRTTVEDYAEAGPMTLWRIESSIQGVIRESRWESSRQTPQCRWRSFD